MTKLHAVPNATNSSGADSYRPLGQIMTDIKKVEADIRNLQTKRLNLVNELKQLSEAAASYAENIVT